MIMKKIVKLSLILVAVLTTMNINAAEGDISLFVRKGKGKKVSFAMNEVKNISLSIYDSKDKLIHTENVHSDKAISRTYDLAALPNGTYFLEAETSAKIVRYAITVVGETAALSQTISSEVFKPVLKNKNGEISLSILNLDKSPVNIKIYDIYENELYNTTVSEEQVIHKFFDIKNFPKEKYTFVMSYDDKVFSKTVTSK